MTEENLVYDAHMNLIPDVKDTDGMTGMSYVDQYRPIDVVKTETIPNDFKDSLTAPREFDVRGGEEIHPDTNPMMVNTVVNLPGSVVAGSNNQYHTLEVDNLDEPIPITAILDTEDMVGLESMVKAFHAAIESAGYEVDFRGQTDPDAPVDLVRLLDEVEYSDGLSLRSSQRIDTINDLKNEVIALGGVTRDQAMAIESLRPSFLSTRVALETYTRFPSKTNYDKTIVALEDLVAGAAVAGVVITVLAVAKLFQWLINKIQSLRYDAKSDTIRAKYLRAHDELLKEVDSSGKRFASIIQKSDKFNDTLLSHAKDLGVQVSSDMKRTAIELDDAMYQFLLQDGFTQFVQSMYNGEAAKLSAYLGTAINNVMVELENKFDKLKAISNTEVIVPLDQFVTTWDGVADLANYLIGGTVGSPEKTIDALGQALNSLHERGTQSNLRFNAALNNMRYSLDKYFRLDQNKAKRLNNWYSTIKRIEANMRNIQDAEVRQNRGDLYTIFKKELQLLAVLINHLDKCDKEAIRYISLTNQVVSRNGRMWVKAFHDANVNFNWQGIK